MSDRLSNALFRHAATLDAQQSAPRFGTIATIDPATHSAKVLIMPENVLTGWLPMGAQGVGNNSGITAPYSQGDQVVVIPTQGSIENGVIICGVYSDAQLPPQVPSSPTGEPSHTEPGGLTIVRGGSSIRLNSDGTIIINTGTLNVVGDLHITGNIISQADVVASGKSLVHHTHRDSLGGNTTPPL